MSRYILAPFAQEDLISIRHYYLEHAGPRIARQVLTEFVVAFRKLARNPGIGHRRRDLSGDRQVLFFALRDYLIIYKSEAKPLQIVTILHGSRDVAVVLDKRNP